MITYRKKLTGHYSMLGLIKRNFIYMDSNTFILLYNSLVRPHLEYANAVWCPYKVGDIEVIEKVKKRATKGPVTLELRPPRLPHAQKNLLIAPNRGERVAIITM